MSYGPLAPRRPKYAGVGKTFTCTSSPISARFCLIVCANAGCGGVSTVYSTTFPPRVWPLASARARATSGLFSG